MNFGKVILILLSISKSYGLLRNCVSPAEWNRERNLPKCELFTNSTQDCHGTTNVISIPRNIANAQEKDETSLKCEANYPIDFDVKGIKLKGPFPKIFLIRRVKNISDPSTFKYSISIPLYAAGLWSPRWIIIKSVTNPKLVTKFYLFRPGPNDQSLPTGWPSEKPTDFIVKPDGFFAVLPCIVSHYSDNVTLTKIGSDSDYHLMETNNADIRFDPTIGFLLDVAVEPPPWGAYQCKTFNPRTRQEEFFPVGGRLVLKDPKDFLQNPDRPKLQLYEGERLDLTCQSKHMVHMAGKINEQEIPRDNFTYTFNSSLNLKYKVEYVGQNLHILDSGQIYCVDSKYDSAVLFKWEFETLDLANNDILQFNAAPSGLEVSCQSKIQALNLFSGECTNFQQCRTRSDFYKTLTPTQCDLPLFNPIKCGQRCGESHRLCFQNTQIQKNGVFICEGRNVYKLMHVVKGWSGKLYSNVDAGLIGVPANELVRIFLGNARLYNGALHTVRCEASGFLSNGEYQWLFRDKNGSIIKPTIEATRAKHDFYNSNNSIWEADIRLDNPNVYEIICLAPHWNSEKWVEVSEKLEINSPIMPTIDKISADKRRFYVGDEKGHTLICTGNGQPFPTYVWKVNGERVTEPFSTFDDNEGGMILEFPEITEMLKETRYRCEASNFAGMISKEFKVEITYKPIIYPYIILAVVLLVFLSITLGILYWKLLKARSAIRNLTDEEIEQFIKGNPEAAQIATEPQELVLFLPYNTDYEITKEQLKFDEKNVLGSGAYGVVFKGVLTDYPEEVAIKTLKPFSAVSYFKALLSELKIMIYIGKHQNVVHLIGAYTAEIKERVLYMVVELSPFGNLENYLRCNQRGFLNEIRNDLICFTKNMMQVTYTNVSSSGSINTLSTTELISWSLQIAEGMNHLASKKVVHADLATRNVLLYDNGIVKITDFGLSRQLYAYTSYMKKEEEPLPWRSMAIESLREMNFSTQSDVWAYGVTLWEIYSLGSVPYPGLSWSVDFVDKLSQGLRLTKPQYANTEIYKLMVHCWHTDPNQRPSFAEIKTIFNAINSSGVVKKMGEY